jgi:hypothetical protein
MDIRSAQKLVWENKVAKGFNTTDVPLEFCLLQGEVAEAFDAWRKGREDLGEELADDGKPLIRDDGKVLKSEWYFPPDIASVLGLEDRLSAPRTDP